MFPQIDPGGIWHLVVFFGMSLSLIGILIKAQVIIPSIPARLLWGYVALSALFILEYPIAHFNKVTPNYQATAGQVLAEIAVIPLAAGLFFPWIKKSLPLFSLFICACVWLGYPGVLNAGSFNTSCAAMLVPFINPYCALIVIITVITHHGSTAMLILAAQGLSLMIRSPKVAKFWIPLIAILFAAAYYHHHGQWFDGYERVQKWKGYLSFWAENPRRIILGVGPGSFMWTSLLIDEFKGALFLQMHSDWLQVLWELGVVGLGLSLWLIYEAVRKSWYRSQVLAGLFGMCAFGLTYYPLRFFPTALICSWILLNALIKN